MSDGKKWYLCDPGRNIVCRKVSCFLYGGPCELTSRAECAQTGPDGKPAEVIPRERLKEKIRRKAVDRIWSIRKNTDGML